VTIPTQIPATLIAGDTWRWTLDLSDYLAPTWVVTAYFTNSDGVFNSIGVASSTSHAFTIAAATTAQQKPGRYAWSLRAVSGSIVETVGDGGYLEVAPDPAGPKRDTRSWARRTLEAIECFLAGNATTAQASMQLRDRSISRWSIKELNEWRDKLRGEVAGEDGAATGGRGRLIKVQITHAR
jgi:hypothetical protein